MPLIAKRLLGVFLALIGLGLTLTGAWFVSHLGTTGTATFTTSIGRSGPVVLDPSVLNRVDVPVTLHATTATGKEVWMGLASPSDARTALKGGAHTSVTGVAVQDWALTTEAHRGDKAPRVSALDLWGEEAQGKGTATLVVHQEGVPETVVVDAPGGDDISTIQASWPKQTWFYQALVVVVAGLLLVLVGVLTALQRGAKPPPGDGGRHRGGDLA